MFGALTEVTAAGSIAPISWWDGTNRQAAPGRPRGGGRILFTCTFLRLGGRAAGPCFPLSGARLVFCVIFFERLELLCAGSWWSR
jgi:hypothetical protein